MGLVARSNGGREFNLDPQLLTLSNEEEVV